jgi:hypothetical protein
VAGTARVVGLRHRAPRRVRLQPDTARHYPRRARRGRHSVPSSCSTLAGRRSMSYYRTRMENPRVRWARACPIRPKPTMPAVA